MPRIPLYSKSIISTCWGIGPISTYWFRQFRGGVLPCTVNCPPLAIREAQGLVSPPVPTKSAAISHYKTSCADGLGEAQKGQVCQRFNLTTLRLKSHQVQISASHGRDYF